MAKYIEEVPFPGEFDVVFIVKKTGVKLVEEFTSPYLAKKFINKVRRSKDCELISYPNVR